MQWLTKKKKKPSLSLCPRGYSPSRADLHELPIAESRSRVLWFKSLGTHEEGKHNRLLALQLYFTYSGLTRNLKEQRCTLTVLDRRLFGLSKRPAAFLGVSTLSALFSEQLGDHLASKRHLACPSCSQHCFHVACVVERVCFDRHFSA